VVCPRWETIYHLLGTLDKIGTVPVKQSGATDRNRMARNLKLLVPSAHNGRGTLGCSCQSTAMLNYATPDVDEIRKALSYIKLFCA
jgi:hypothetical protein